MNSTECPSRQEVLSINSLTNDDDMEEEITFGFAADSSIFREDDCGKAISTSDDSDCSSTDTVIECENCEKLRKEKEFILNQLKVYIIRRILKHKLKKRFQLLLARRQEQNNLKKNYLVSLAYNFLNVVATPILGSQRLQLLANILLEHFCSANYRSPLNMFGIVLYNYAGGVTDSVMEYYNRQQVLA